MLNSTPSKIHGSLASLLQRSAGKQEPDQGVEEADLPARVAGLEKEMLRAASALDFETAIRLRDEVRRLQMLMLEVAP